MNWYILMLKQFYKSQNSYLNMKNTNTMEYSYCIILIASILSIISDCINTIITLVADITTFRYSPRVTESSTDKKHIQDLFVYFEMVPITEYQLRSSIPIFIHIKWIRKETSAIQFNQKEHNFKFIQECTHRAMHITIGIMCQRSGRSELITVKLLLKH